MKDERVDWIAPLKDWKTIVVMLLICSMFFYGMKVGTHNGRVELCEEVGGLMTVEHGCIKETKELARGFTDNLQVYKLGFPGYNPEEDTLNGQFPNQLFN